MERTIKYNTLKEAEEVRQTYSSWIGKKAYTAAGRQETLRNIVIRSASAAGSTIVIKGFFVEFEFESKSVSAYEFMSMNGLISLRGASSRR